MVVLNSECEPAVAGCWLPGGCAAGSAQDLWLKSDLANAPTNNIIAMWHKPRSRRPRALRTCSSCGRISTTAGADIVLGGHWHNYERFAPMNATGAPIRRFGVREFASAPAARPDGFGTILPTSQVRTRAPTA